MSGQGHFGKGERLTGGGKRIICFAFPFFVYISTCKSYNHTIKNCQIEEVIEKGILKFITLKKLLKH